MFRKSSLRHWMPGWRLPAMLVIALGAVDAVNADELQTLEPTSEPHVIKTASVPEQSDREDKDSDFVRPDSYRLTNDRKLLGWRVSETVYFGRTKINRKNNVGLVFDRGATTISLGHKGLFYSFRF